MLIFIALIAGLSLEVALLAAERIVTSNSMRRSAEDLHAAKSVFRRQMRYRADFANAQCRLIAEIPIFRATIDKNDSATVAVMAEDYRQKLRAEFCIVTNADGHWLAKPGWPAALPPVPALQAAIKSAQAGNSFQGYVAMAGHLFLVTCEPARFAEDVLGTLLAGYRLDDAVAQELAQMTGCEVSFVIGNRLYASSLENSRQGALEAALAGSQQEWKGGGSTLHTLAGATYVGGTYPLSPRGSPFDTGELVLLQAWRLTQASLEDVRTALSAVLGLAFALALAGGLVFTHRVTRPLHDIVTAAEEIAAGDWDRQAPQAGRTEIAVMATAFNQMTANLRHWYQEAQSRSERLAETLTQLQHAHRATLEALSRALDARDNETEGHSLRVAHYALRLAEQMDLDEEALSSLRWGALLHDVGKIGVSDMILHKPARLTPEEMREMQRHCEFGLDIVRDIPYLERAADVIGCHHERYDGGGYPRGLQGEAIPLGARIFSVADTLDAITSDRPYRSASSFPKALNEIEQHTGTQFDPAVIAALRTLLQELEEWRQEIQPRQAALVRALGEL